ncbi:N-acetylmuramoyl-L-alanine amidase [Spirulina major]|uniref:N-acetylmuramoyl-L-alanine amidase n=1 Tax=Spirulina major TaxID=270636 RepID=UPI0009320E63|nr:N-acetylmuramoyl-L-alanine amidase [Spirulina major]
MTLRWLTLSLLGLVLWASPAEAGRLTSWQFDNRANQLRFTTDDGVQPTAKLIANPARLIIDLPGTILSRPTVTQRVGGTIREVRIGQFNASTTRLVIELAPGYTLDPERVEFRGTSDRQWQVTLPPPERIDLNQSPVTGLDNFQVTQNGFFVRLAELAQPQATVRRSGDRKEIAVSIRGNRIPDNLQDQTILINRYGVDTIRFEPDVIRLTVAADGPDWRAAVSRAGIAIVPSGGQVLNGDRTTVPLPSDEQVVQIPVPPPERITPPQPTANPGDFRVPNSRILTTIDPGHGGRDPGAIGIGGLQEKDVVLPISLEVARILSEAGVSVLMTRSDDRFISLQERAVMANRARSTLFVSIHANAISMSRPDVNGVETYFFSSRSRNFANTVHQSILNQIRIGNRGVKQARFYVLRNTAMPSILVEVGFVTGAQDAPRLADPAFRDQMARAIADGILRYVSDNY